jgi:nitroreductase
MRNTPATRRFRPDPVPAEAIARVLDNARFAPSGGNRQPWRVIVVDDPALRRRLGELYLPSWEAYMERMGARALLDQAGDEPSGRLAGLRAADEFARRLGEVPLHLVICVEMASLAIVDRGLDRPSVVGGASIYPFVQNVLLGLRREGLGAAFTTLLTPAEPEVRELLELPEGIAVAGHIAVGYREGDWPRRLSRRPVAEFAFANRFGATWRPPGP